MATTTLVGIVTNVVVGNMATIIVTAIPLTVDVRVVAVDCAAKVEVERVTPIQECADAYEEELEQFIAGVGMLEDAWVILRSCTAEVVSGYRDSGSVPLRARQGHDSLAAKVARHR